MASFACWHCKTIVVQDDVVIRQFDVFTKTTHHGKGKLRTIERESRCLCTGDGGHGLSEVMLLESEGFRFDRTRRPTGDPGKVCACGLSMAACAMDDCPIASDPMS